MVAKKLSLSVVFVLLLAPLAYAEGTNPETGQPYGMAGCGLGSYLLGEKTEKHWQVLACTVNNIVSPQSYAITSGTSNCSSKGKQASLDLYVETNRIALANDVARGNGETLAGLSDMLGCSDSATLGKTLQKNYGKIFPEPGVDSRAVSQSILKTVHQDSSLSQTCQG